MRTLTLKQPLKGLNEVLRYDVIPPEYAVVAQNVRPFDRGNGRLRLGQRAGAAKWASLVAGTGAVRLLRQIGLETITTGTTWSDSFGSQADNHYVTAAPANAAAYNALPSGPCGNDYYIATHKAGATTHTGHYYTMYKADNDTVVITATWEVGNYVIAGTSRDSIYIVFGDNTYIDPAAYRFRAISINSVGSNVDFFKADGTDDLQQDTSPSGWSAGDTINVTVTITPASVTIAVAGHGTKTYNTPVGFDYSNLTGLEAFLYVEFPQKVGANTPGDFTALSVSTASSLATYDAKVLIVVGGDIKLWGWNTGFTTPTGGSGALNTTGEVYAVEAFNKVYITDSTHFKVLDIGANTVSSFAASVGSVPTDAQVLCLFHGRLVLRSPSDPTNWFMSRLGDPTDYDYGAADDAGAISGDDADAGKLAMPLTAAMPISATSMLMAADNQIWVMRGDPRTAGVLDLLSDQVGCVGFSAWCQGPDGTMYWLSHSGLMVYKATFGAGGAFGTRIENISYDKLDASIQADYTTHYAEMCWHVGERSIYLVFRPVDLTAATSVVVWNSASDTFVTDTYPVSVGPQAMGSVYFKSDVTMLLGGRDGYVRNLNIASLTDDGTNIASLVRFAPVMLSEDPDSLGRIVAARFNWFNEVATFGVTYNYYVGDTATQAATSNSPIYTNTLAAGGYQTLDRARARGAYFCLEMMNPGSASGWANELSLIEVVPAGRIRT